LHRQSGGGVAIDTRVCRHKCKHRLSKSLTEIGTALGDLPGSFWATHHFGPLHKQECATYIYNIYTHTLSCLLDMQQYSTIYGCMLDLTPSTPSSKPSKPMYVVIFCSVWLPTVLACLPRAQSFKGDPSYPAVSLPCQAASSVTLHSSPGQAWLQILQSARFGIIWVHFGLACDPWAGRECVTASDFQCMWMHLEGFPI
jgi:hypothetical protein